MGSFDNWIAHASRALSLGFNWLYLNPITYPGFSRSLYATKDYYRLNPAFLPDSAGHDSLQTLAPVIRSIADLGIHPMVDLVINHTSIDSLLIQEHPSWYRWDEAGKIRNPCAVDPDDPMKKTVWGDLAEVDNHHSPDRETLWGYWADLVRAYLSIGFEGFRCDAAYKVPVDLWRYLIQTAQRVNPHALFLAENLGCTIHQTRVLRKTGFHFFFNSSKWWNFEDGWCLDQHKEFEDLPSISFPETHDTERLAYVTGGKEAIQRQRYAFAATFSAGLLVPIGYEFGFQKKLDVVETQPTDWERSKFDLSSFVKAVNSLKAQTPLLQGEGHIERVVSSHSDLLLLERRSEDAPGERGWIVVNKNSVAPRPFLRESLPAGEENLWLVRLSQAERFIEPEICPQEVTLDPAEVVLFLLHEK